jgi:hypothetical protein
VALAGKETEMPKVGRLGTTLIAAVGILLLGAVFMAGATLAPSGLTGGATTASAQEAGPGMACPFMGADGSMDIEAMRAQMDAMHGEGSFDQMWAEMGTSMAEMHGAGGMPHGGMGGAMHGSMH